MDEDYISYVLSLLLYLTLGALATVLAFSASFQWIIPPSSLTWVRIHFVTLGILTQTLFVFIPRRLGSKTTRWDIWVLFNTGFIAFFYGRSILDEVIMNVGGLFIFVATLLFLIQVLRLRTSEYPTDWFYIFGTFFLFVGITVGTGIWSSWGKFLYAGNLVEVHIHANNWGFMAMVFTGLVFDSYTKVTSKRIQFESSPIYILIFEILGASGLILGPWLSNIPITVAGMLFFIVATIIFLLDIFLPFRGEAKPIGFLHIIFGYIWIFAPLIIAPFVIFKVNGFQLVEPNAPQALIYGWVLQVGIALLVYLIFPKKGIYGGTRYSLVLLNLGAILLWIGIFSPASVEIFRGFAYVSWFLALLFILNQVFSIYSEETLKT